jgi:hypothetical protein
MLGFSDDGFTKLPAGRSRNYRTRLQGGRDKKQKEDGIADPRFSFFLQAFSASHRKNFCEISAMSVTIGEGWQSGVNSP